MKNLSIKWVCISLLLVSFGGIYPLTYVWESKEDEPAFKLDVPGDWETDYLVKKNGVIVFFRDKRAVIEVRSFFTDNDASFRSLMNAKAARLSAKYKTVKLIHEKKSRYKENMYLASWRLYNRGQSYLEKTAFIAEEDLVVSISCVSPARDYKKYKVAFDNAILSASMFESDGQDDGPRTGIRRLRELYLFNIPNSNNQISAPQ